MKENNIYSWRWKDEARHSNRGSFGNYHCYSQIAVVKNGRLYDTYWSDQSKEIFKKKVILTFLGNSEEMTKLQEWKVNYYRKSDIVDMRHANDTRGIIYLKKGAKKDAEVMLEYVEYKIKNSEDNIRSETRNVEWYTEMKDQINSGKLDEILF
ncbi:MAG: hypothetical protein GY928_12060 [Colwellia sp.]|nr:hypothetical protein [Colwellia sp.]